MKNAVTGQVPLRWLKAFIGFFAFVSYLKFILTYFERVEIYDSEMKVVKIATAT